MIALLELIVLLIGPAISGAALLHLWQTRTHRQRYSGFTIGKTPMRIRTHEQATRRPAFREAAAD